MSALASLLPDLETALEHGTRERRERALSQITTLFINGATQFTEEHVELFDEVFGLLITEIETKARAQLALRLASIPNAPADLVRRLAADDDIAVAAPLLRESPRLSEADLVMIAQNQSQAHLLAISARRGLGEAVTDVLIGRGNQDVMHGVAENAQARLSDSAFTTLVKRAEFDGALAEKVGLRSDIPARLFRNLLAQASEIVQKRLLARAKPEIADEIRRVLADVTTEIGERARPRDYTRAKQNVLAVRRRAGTLGEAELAIFALDEKFEEAVVCLSLLCKVPVEVVDRLICGDRPDPVLILCKAVGFGWATVKAILGVLPQRKAATSRSLDEAFANFEKLSPQTAERVVRFWQVRQSETEPAHA